MAQIPNENAIHTTIRAIVDGTMRMEDLYGYFGSKKEALEYYAWHIRPVAGKQNYLTLCECCSHTAPTHKVTFSWNATTDFKIKDNILKMFVLIPVVLISRTLAKSLFPGELLDSETVGLQYDYYICRPCWIKARMRGLAGEFLRLVFIFSCILVPLTLIFGTLAICQVQKQDLESTALNVAIASGGFLALLFLAKRFSPTIFAPSTLRRFAPNPFKLDCSRFVSTRLFN